MKTPKMTKSHFEFIASTLRQADLDAPDHAWLVKLFAERLAWTNGMFDAQRFIHASKLPHVDGTKSEKLYDY